MQLPETYWSDVNRYYDEILVDMPAIREGKAPFITDTVEYFWPAQEPDTTAHISKQTCRVLGTVTFTHHRLGLSRNEFDTWMTHWIRFDPARNKIVRVEDDSYSSTQKATIPEQVRTLWQRHQMARHIGILLPTKEDYALLSDELRRGAQFRSYDVGEAT